MASGIPWPRIFSDPNFAMIPTMSPPITGIRIRIGPSGVPATGRESDVQRP